MLKSSQPILRSNLNLSNNNYVLSYTVTIRNEGKKSARLLTRHWVITDGDGQVQEVRGEGVIGKQPHLSPGRKFQRHLEHFHEHTWWHHAWQLSNDY